MCDAVSSELESDAPIQIPSTTTVHFIIIALLLAAFQLLCNGKVGRDLKAVSRFRIFAFCSLEALTTRNKTTIDYSNFFKSVRQHVDFGIFTSLKPSIVELLFSLISPKAFSKSKVNQAVKYSIRAMPLLYFVHAVVIVDDEQYDRKYDKCMKHAH
ncbi:hypothetical protein T4E_7255 [Trichinella pseudospiralis]|uniref:Uncharacterized protein n=1 Tax=Trichinella pseudospiralis TaxID=6337 RepID=A0A0V0YC00_TRIPS|nr:hypothetical protein T4E_7255 [Trichinella pseudospiralis]